MRNIMMYGLALLWAAPVLAQEAKSSFTDFTDWPRLEHAHVALPDLVKDTALLRRYAADLYTYLAQQEKEVRLAPALRLRFQLLKLRSLLLAGQWVAA